MTSQVDDPPRRHLRPRRLALWALLGAVAGASLHVAFWWFIDPARGNSHMLLSWWTVLATAIGAMGGMRCGVAIHDKGGESR
jgi:hypothetical protein